MNVASVAEGRARAMCEARDRKRRAEDYTLYREKIRSEYGGTQPRNRKYKQRNFFMMGKEGRHERTRNSCA